METKSEADGVEFGCRIETARRMADAIDNWAIALATATEMGVERNAEAIGTHRSTLELRIADWLNADGEFREQHDIEDDGPAVQFPNSTASMGAFRLLNSASKNMDRVCEQTLDDIQWPAFNWTKLSQKTASKLQGNGKMLRRFVEGAEQFRQKIGRYNREFLKQELLARAARHRESLPKVSAQQLAEQFDSSYKTIQRHLEDCGVLPLIQGKNGVATLYPREAAELACQPRFKPRKKLPKASDTDG